MQVGKEKELDVRKSVKMDDDKDKKKKVYQKPYLKWKGKIETSVPEVLTQTPAICWTASIDGTA